MTFKDHFSQHAGEYARHRPTYPDELFAYLASIAPDRALAWDCGTGNGQAARGLARYFSLIIATDASAEQIQNAFPDERVTYRVGAEDAGPGPGSADLVTVAQALHWFDLDKFYEAAQLALKPGGVLAVWAYSLCRISPGVDHILDSFYFGTVGPYWPKERVLIDDGYRTIPFPFDEIQPPEFSIRLDWSLNDLLAYLRTWSPTKRFIAANGYDPVTLVEDNLVREWGNANEEKSVVWPLHIRVGKPRQP